MSIIGEFKEFALKGNVVDLAVGVIIGAAFGKLVESVVGDLIMPVVSLLVGKIDFSNLFIVLGTVPEGTLRTLEALKKAGVPVIAYGQDDFPAFWSRSYGLKAPLRMDRAADIAAAHRMRARLGLPGGQLVANPIPVSAEISRGEITPHIEAALAEAEAQGIAAKAVTPFLLSRIFELTQGRSLESNIELVLNNARLAARIAAAMA